MLFKRDETPSETFPVTKTDAEWRASLSPEAFRVLRQHGTERPGTSPLNAEKRPGTFTCAGCGTPLFDAGTKFESGTGWPSFFAPIEGGVAEKTDRSFFMTRTEVHCAQLRRPSGARVSRRAAAHGPALLHERRVAQLPPRRGLTHRGRRRCRPRTG